MRKNGCTPLLQKKLAHPLSTAHTAKLLGVSLSVLAYLRKTMRGPAWTYVNGRCWYERESVLHWKEYVPIAKAAQLLNIPAAWLTKALTDASAPQPQFFGHKRYTIKELQTWFSQIFGEGMAFSDLMTAADIARQCNVSRSYISILKKKHKLPEPKAIFMNRPYWDKETIQTWHDKGFIECPI